jgi:hypothetical protein
VEDYYFNFDAKNPAKARKKDPMNQLKPSVFKWDFQKFNNNSKSPLGKGNTNGPGVPLDKKFIPNNESKSNSTGGGTT